jgi:protein-disulfide isomerase-like protein with CxxC motif
MRNPKTVQLAQVIAETFPHLLVEREENVVTLEDGEGERYLVTVESMYRATESEPLPDPE